MKRALSASLTVSEKILHFAGKCGSRANASFPPAVRADVWCGGREVASKQAQCGERRGTCWWNYLFTPSTCSAGIEPTQPRQTVLQEGTGVCAGAQSLRTVRRPQPLDSRLQASSPACHVVLVDAKHTWPPRPGRGPGKSPARADHHDARQGVPCATLRWWSVRRPGSLPRVTKRP